MFIVHLNYPELLRLLSSTSLAICSNSSSFLFFYY